MTEMLEPRLAAGFRIHPVEGEKLGLSSGEIAKTRFNDLDLENIIIFDSQVPEGVILAPRHQVKGLRVPAGAEVLDLD